MSTSKQLPHGGLPTTRSTSHHHHVYIMLTALTKARGVFQRSASIGIRSVGTYPVPAPLVGTTRYDQAGYEATYAQSLADPAAFWGEHARERLEWITPFTDAKTMDVDLNTGHIKVRRP